MKPQGIAYVLAALALVVTGQTLLKLGMTRVGEIGLERLRRPLRLLGDVAGRWEVWLGLAIYALSAALWLLALATAPASIAYSFLGLSYLAVAGMSVRFLGEWLTPAQWIGIALAGIGVVIVAVCA